MRDLNLTFTQEPIVVIGIPPDRLTGRAESPQGQVDRVARELMGPQVRELLGSVTFSAQTGPLSVSGFGGVDLGPDGRQATVRVQSGLADAVTWVTGAMPGPASRTATLPRAGGFGNRTVDVVPVALAAAVADDWRVGVGDRLRLEPPNVNRFGAEAIVVEVVGTFRARDPGSAFWSASTMLTAGSIPSPEGGSIATSVLVTDPVNYSALGTALVPQVDLGARLPAPGLTHVWRYVLDERALNAADIPALVDAVSRLSTAAPRAWLPDRSAPISAGTDLTPKVITGLPSIVDSYRHSVAVTSALLLFIALGVVALSSITLTLTALVLTERHTAALRLLRSRGGSLRQLSFVVAEVLVWSVPVAAGVGAAATVLVPGVTPASALVLAGAPVAVAALAALARTVSIIASGGGARPTRPSRAARLRRICAELLVLAAAAFTLGTVRSRGARILAGQSDWYAALAPVLLSAALAVVVIRLYPLPVRLAAAAAGRGRSTLGFLALTRAARERGAALVPLTALVIAATLATFLASVTASIQRERNSASYQVVGADVRVDAVRLDPDELAALARRPGVSAVVPAYRETGAQVRSEGGGGSQSVTLLAADPSRYASALRGTPIAFAAPAPPTSTGRVPVLVSEPLRAGVRDLVLTVGGRPVPVEVRGIASGLDRRTPAAPFPTVLLDLARLTEVRPSTQVNTAYVMGSAAAAAALSTGPPPAGLSTGVRDRRALAAAVASRALPELVRVMTLAGVILAVGFSVLAVLQLLTLTRAERRALTMRLRTMGLPHGGEWRLGLIEVAPLALTAIIPGMALGLSLPRLLRSVIDLAPYTGGAAFPPVRASTPWTAAIGAGLLAVVVAAVLIDAVRARRSRLADHLRAGEAP